MSLQEFEQTEQLEHAKIMGLDVFALNAEDRELVIQSLKIHKGLKGWVKFDLDNYEEELPKPEIGKLLIIDGRYKNNSRTEIFYCMDFGMEKQWRRYPMKSIETTFDEENFRETYYRIIDQA